MIAFQAFQVEDYIVILASVGGKEKELALKCSPEEFMQGVNAYSSGSLMQDAFPFLSADEREFLISGITPKEWEETFGKQEE
jgi:hypothetical protein